MEDSATPENTRKVAKLRIKVFSGKQCFNV